MGNGVGRGGEGGIKQERCVCVFWGIYIYINKISGVFKVSVRLDPHPDTG